MSDAPRILFFTDTYPPQVNGVSVVTALSVAGLARRGWEVAVVSPRYPRHVRNAFATEMERSPHVAQLDLPSAPLPFYSDLRLSLPRFSSVHNFVRDFAPQAIHCETEFVIGAMGRRIARSASLPLTTSYHTDFSRYTESYGVGWMRNSVQRYLASFHRTSDLVFTPSAAARDDLLKLGVTQARVWGCGVDTTVFSPVHRSASFRMAYGHSGTCLFLYVGRLAAEKGVDKVVAAFHLAANQLPEGAIHLIVAGLGPEEQALRAQAGPHVTFMGNLDRSEVLPKLYASCDAFVFASLTETLGLVVLEAMASGLPVLAAPTAGVAAHLRDGVNGLTYPPGDTAEFARAMLRVALRPTLRSTLAIGAVATAAQLTWEAELDRLDETYRDLLSKPASNPRRTMSAA